MARRHVSLIVRTETRRRFRAVLDDPKRLIPFALVATFGTMFVFAFGAGGYYAGRAAATEPFGAVAGTAGTIAGFLVAFSGFVVGLRVVQTGALSEGADLLLTAARHRDVVYGHLVIESLLPFGLLAVPGALAAAAFGVGSGSPVSVLLFAVAGVSAATVGVTGGFAVGLAVRLLVARWAFLAKYKTAVGLLAGVVYFLALTSDAFADVFGRAAEVLAASPLRWFADLVLLGTASGASPVRAAGALALIAASSAVFVGASSRLAARIWYETPVEPASDAHGSAMGGLPGLGRPTSRVVRKTWVRARRSPIRLLYVVYPLFLFLGPAVTVVRDGVVPPGAVPALVLYGAWAAGAAFTLNPIGDETPTLPVTLTTAVDGRTFVGALCLSGVVVAVPVTTLAALAVGVAGEFGLRDLLIAGILGATLPALAPALASGIGAVFPRTTPASVTRSRRAVVPSIPAFAGFSFALSVLSTPVWLATPGTGRGVIADVTGMGQAATAAVAVIATLVLVGLASAVSFRIAARRVDEYTVE